MTSPRGLRSLSRALSLALIAHAASGCWFVVDSFDDAPATGEQGGASGSSGASGSAGTGGSAGASGSAGAGGSAGSPCQAGTFECRDDALFACDPATEVYTSSAQCEKGLCDSQQGRCLTCSPGAVQTCHDDQSLVVCSEDGSGTTFKACTGTTPRCQDGTPARCVACLKDDDCEQPPEDCEQATCTAGVCLKTHIPSGEKARNHGNDVCVDSRCDGTGKLTSSPSPPGATCATGVCNGQGACGVCNPGDGTTAAEVQCASPSTVQSCGPDGQWMNASTCSAAKPACSVDACLSVVQLASGDDHSCALLTDGTVRCWGDNSSGQLGTGPDTVGQMSTKPVEVPGLTGVSSIQLGLAHSCALLTSNEVKCWGSNVVGSIGVGTTGSLVPSPTTVNSKVPFVQLAVGSRHSCAVTDKGDLHCWGHNKYAQSGQDTSQPGFEQAVSLPTKVESFSSIAQVAAGDDYTCVVDNVGKLSCWGNNEHGQLGDGVMTTNYTFNPKQVPGLPVIQKVKAGRSHVIAFGVPDIAGAKFSYWRWGSGEHGELFVHTNNNPGIPPDKDYATPIKYIKDDLIKSIDDFIPGHMTTSAIFFGYVQNTGDNSSGQLGMGTDATDPSTLNTIVGTTQIAPGARHMCALQNIGKVSCWGRGTEGQLGHGDTADHVIPVEVIW